MQWWASCCAYRCEKNPIRGTFDDQRYLDLLPVMDERVHILRHKGCNVADWNRQEIPRSMQGEQLILADNTRSSLFILTIPLFALLFKDENRC
jgi:hypothetical protein